MKEIITLRKFFILSFMLLVFVMIANSQSKQNRNLKDSVVGPTFEDSESHWGNGDLALIFEKRNIYLWDVWNKKQLTYFTENTYNRHGKKIPCVFYVEKTNKDSWQITVECDRINICPYVSEKHCQEYRYTTEIYDRIEKIERKDGKFELLFHNIKKKRNP